MMTGMKRILPIILVVSVLLGSCTATNVFGDEYAMDQSISVEEKLLHYGGVPVLVNEPESYFEGTVAVERLTELVNECEDYIFISTFLGSYVPSLDAFYGAVAQKAMEGVDVYIIMDGISSLDMTESRWYMTPLYFLRESGVHVLEYSPMSLPRAINPMELMVRDHRKLFVFDGKSCAIGGMNINYISMGAGPEKNQRDSMHIFESSYDLSKAFVDEFVSNWNDASVEKIKAEDFNTYSDEVKGDIKAYLFNQVHGGEIQVADLYSTLINSAEESIRILPFLPVLDKDMSECIRRAVDRGVDVQIVMPMDSRGYAEAGVRYLLPKLAATGADIYISLVDEDHPMLHEKLMVVDGRYSVIGSSNLNLRSMQFAHEIALVLDDEDLAEGFLDHIESLRLADTIHVDEDTAREMKKNGGSWLAYMSIYFGG